MNLDNLRVYVVSKVRISPQGTLYKDMEYKIERTGPFDVLKVSSYSTPDDWGHVLLIRDGLKLRTVNEHDVEIVTPLTEALE